MKPTAIFKLLQKVILTCLGSWTNLSNIQAKLKPDRNCMQFISTDMNGC